MNRHQEHLFGLMKEIHEICEKHDITYFLAFGTLIGAVRHKGFLPWDDDCDLFMPYDQWLKFQEVCSDPANLPPNRVLCSAGTHESFCHLLPRYVATDVTAIHTNQSLHDDYAGQVIDIFVLDPVADSQEAYDAYAKAISMYSDIITYSNSGGSRFDIDVKEYQRLLGVKRTQGKLEAVRQAEAAIEACFDADGHRCCHRSNIGLDSFEREWFAESTTVTFEGFEFKAPRNYAAVLRQSYGDEWCMVPTKPPIAKHNGAFSLDFPYTEALEYYTCVCDRPKLAEEMFDRKATILKNAPEKNRLAEVRGKAKADFRVCELMQRINADRAGFEAALAARDGIALNEYLADYIRLQLSFELAGRSTFQGLRRRHFPVLVDVEPAIAEGALYVLFATERVSKAARLLEIRRFAGAELTPAMLEVDEAITTYRSAVDDYVFGRYGDGLAKAAELSKAWPQASSFHKLKCSFFQVVASLDDSDESDRAYRGSIEEGARLFAEDGFYEKAQADFLWEDGKTEEATALYAQAAEHTYNGLVLLDIAQRTGYYPEWQRKAVWAADGNIPVWDGPKTPKKKAVIPTSEEELAGEPAQRYLFKLLVEVTELCDANKLEYLLCPEAAHALFTVGKLPSNIPNYCLVIEPATAAKLWSLSGSLPKNRFMRHCATKSEPAYVEMRYYGADSLYVNLHRKAARVDNSLYVTLRVLAPKAYDGMMERVVRQWCSDDLKMLDKYSPRGSKTQMYALMHGLRGERQKVGAKIVAETAKMLASSSQDRYLSVAGEATKFDTAFFKGAVRKSFAGHEFCIPADMKRYDRIGKKGEKTTDELQTGFGAIYSADMTYADFMKLGIFDPKYFEQRTAAGSDDAEIAIPRTEFNDNFRRIVCAVRVKQAKFDLLPRKQEIMDLYAAENWAALRKIMADYLATFKRFATYGYQLEFDHELYEIAKETRKHRK